MPSQPSVRVQTSAIALTLFTLSLLTCLNIDSALAAPPVVNTPGDTESEQGDNNDNGPFGFLSGISRQNGLLGDMWGLRPAISNYGMTLSLQETSELFGNLSGGTRQGFEYDGLSVMDLQLDTQRAFGWHGGTFNVSGLQTHGRNLSQDNLGTLQTSSGIEADRSTRLWELWYQQKFLDEDRLDVKVGQQSLDQEFMVSQNANYFVNTMFGWPMVPSADMPAGGPAYPLSAVGVRAREKATDSLTFLTGVFNGSPVGNSNGDPQKRNPGGTSFPLNNGLLVIAEMQYAYPALGSMVSADESAPLARLYKIGIWYDTQTFADQRFDNTGRSLADPLSSGTLQSHYGDYALYAVADQMLWQSENEADRTLNFFTRVMGTPQTDRNLIDFSLNAGFTLHEPFEHRDDDTFGISVGYAHVSNRAAALDRDTAVFNNSFNPARTSETFVEMTYQYQLTSWWQLQPDIQYVFNPGGGVANPNTTSDKIKNEAIVGLRTTIVF